MSGDLCVIGGGAEVRPARQDEIHAAAQLVADSFAPVEPYVAWLFPPCCRPRRPPSPPCRAVGDRCLAGRNINGGNAPHRQWGERA